jgi:Stage II sporulation protein E (SpoIIE)
MVNQWRSKARGRWELWGNWDCSVQEFCMAECDRLLLVSDGVAESRNAQGPRFLDTQIRNESLLNRR